MKKVAKYLLIILVGFSVGYVFSEIIKKHTEEKQGERRIQTLPSAFFESLTGEEVNLHDFDPEKPMVIVYFHPECEYCRYEAQDIVQNITAFHHCQMVLITPDDSIKRVENFCTKYHLWELNNFEILIDPNNQFKKVFGKALIPSIYIYDKNWQFKRYFPGETKPEAIISEIK